MRIYSLGSGSKGNAVLVDSDEAALLIDCGMSAKSLRERLACVVPDSETVLSRLAGVLITHSHVDHIQGLRGVLKRHPDLPVFANAMTAETVAHDLELGEETFVLFENGQSFDVGPFAVSPFSIPHDTADPVGYLIRGDVTYFHGTDIGSPLDSVGLKLAEAEVAVLESNHDPVMLHHSGRPPSIIQRIFGPRGHLANDQAAELVRKFASPRLKTLALAHLSRDCNAPHLAEREMKAALAAIARSDVELKILDQSTPVRLF